MMLTAVPVWPLALQYNLTLTASDTYHENKTFVYIKIKDINDLPPKFEQASYDTTIPEEDNRGLPKKILQVFSVWFYLCFTFISSSIRHSFGDD